MTPEALAYCEKQAQRIAELEQQRDELLDALIDVIGFIDYVGETDDESVESAKSVIAEVKQSISPRSEHRHAES